MEWCDKHQLGYREICEDCFKDTSQRIAELEAELADAKLYIEQLRGALGYSVRGDIPCNPEIVNGIAEALHVQLADCREKLLKGGDCRNENDTWDWVPM